MKARDDAVEQCATCQSKMVKLGEMNQILKERDEQIARYIEPNRNVILFYPYIFVRLSLSASPNDG